ncbi:MAG: hypothetical protein COB36_07710 [Alphaproteobacteria bacterium]|nr:MAG: hypothetical protein COB36_07710 [Alphaproteobacteria bacterium]
MKEERLNPQGENNIGSKTEGALFLAMSFFALLTLGILGYLKFSGMDQPPVFGSAVVQEDVVLQTALTPIQQNIAGKLPASRDVMVAPQKVALQGKWVSLFVHGGVVNLSFSDENFEIIYMKSSDSSVRKYSRGHYQYNEETGKITLYPSKDSGMPAPVADVYYKILTMRHYDIFILKMVDDVSLYFVAPEAEIPQKNYYPLFSYADYDGAPVLQFFPMQVQQ